MTAPIQPIPVKAMAPPALAVHAPTPRPVMTPPPAAKGVLSSQDMMDQYVKNALCQRRRNPTAYSFVLAQVRNPGSPAVLAGWLRALAKSSSELNADARDLLGIIFRLDFTADQAVQDAFLALMLDLSTSHSTYVPQMIRCLLPHLSPVRIGPGGPYDTEKSERVHCGIVQALQELLRLVPLSSGPIWQTIVDSYPHRRHDTAVQIAWLDASLSICRTSPGIREPILGVIVNRLLQMDVEIRVEDSDDDVVDSDAFFKLELDSPAPPGEVVVPTVVPAGTAHATTASAVVNPAAAQAKSENKELAEKLDALMMKLFDYVDQCLDDANPTRREEFQIMLNHFLHYVLPTHRSKFIQFLLFRACKHSPAEFSEAFLSELMHRAKDDLSASQPQQASPNILTNGQGPSSSSPAPSFTPTPLVTRIAACGYVASFLARANYVPVEIVGRYLTEMIGLAGSCAYSATISRKSSPSTYRSLSYAYQQSQPQVDAPSAHAELFYAAIQAAMYIFCFWHENLIKYSKEHGVEPQQWLSSLGFEQAMSSPLAPLKNCSQSVCLEFETIWANVTGTSLSRYSSASNFSCCSSSSSSLDTFFPFDPYLLPRSSKFIDPLFNDWKSVDDKEDGADKENNGSDDKIRVKKEASDDDEEEDQPAGAVPITARGSGSVSGTPMSLGAQAMSVSVGHAGTPGSLLQKFEEANFKFIF